MITIRPRFSQEQIRRHINQEKEKIKKIIISRLQFVGEQFVRDARQNGSYQDQTGNLRNSVGYVILYNGLQLVDNFQTFVKITSDKADVKDEGVSKAKAMVNRLISQGTVPSNGFVLICVAGMEYAAAVEANGKDVITGSSLQAIGQLEKYMKM